MGGFFICTYLYFRIVFKMDDLMNETSIINNDENKSHMEMLVNMISYYIIDVYIYIYIIGKYFNICNIGPCYDIIS